MGGLSHRAEAGGHCSMVPERQAAQHEDGQVGRVASGLNLYLPGGGCPGARQMATQTAQTPAGMTNLVPQS